MRYEYLYVALAIILGVLFYLFEKRKVFGRHVHSDVLIRAMSVNTALHILFAFFCIITFFTIRGVVSGYEIRYTVDLFSTLLRTSVVETKSIAVMNFAFYILEVVTMLVAAKISIKRKAHKNLKLERILTSDCVVCAVLTFLSTVVLGLSFVLL